ncbi:MAG: hypothetical protein ACR2JI_09055, partial [Mycobacterium sp.]
MAASVVEQSQSERREFSPGPGRRRPLPVVLWLQAGAAAAAAGIALAAAPTATADDTGASATSGSASPERSTAAHGGAQRGSAAVSRRGAAPARSNSTPAGTADTNPKPPPSRAHPAAARAVRVAAPVANPVLDTAPAASPLLVPVNTTAAATAATDIRLAVFGDAGNSYTNGTNFYYSPGGYKRKDTGASGPQQQAVAEMMRSWNPSDVIQLGDESYNSASTTMLDYNIGQYYNNWIAPYTPPAYTQPGSIYTDGTLGGVPASPGKTQWPYNLYNFPNGFPNPADPTKPGGSPDGVN